MERYKSELEVSSLWQGATSAITQHIKDREPLGSGATWSFNEAVVNHQHGGGYSVTYKMSAFDSNVSEIVELFVQANVTESDEISVQTNRREKKEDSF
jgi:hypothetical protein